MKVPEARHRIVVAIDSGWGDDYYYHLECDGPSGEAGDRRELRLSELEPTRWHCYYCHYGLDQPAHPDHPRDLI